jgi:uncharacterized protein YjbI with pentapeptide repeats
MLNVGKCTFSGRDLSRVKIRDAYLRGAIIDRTNFEGADLTNVELSNSYIN